MKKSMAVFLLSSSLSFAQISISSTDLLGLKGTSVTTINDTTGVEVNIGSAGENQTWDFSSLHLQGFVLQNDFLDSSQAPNIVEFSKANLVQRSFVTGDGGESIYSYYEISEHALVSLGSSYSFEGTFFVESVEHDMTALPVEYGANWFSVERDTIGIPDYYYIYADSTYTTIDGWGTVTVPGGVFDCLRLRDNNFYIEQEIVLGELVSADTTTTINYEWLTKDNFVVAIIESFEIPGAETDPNFTLAGYVSLLQSSEVSAIEDDLATAPVDFILGQNYPNPFNPETYISYQLPVNSNVSLKIYDNLGSEIVTLVDKWQNAGSHTIQFDAKGLASGIYYYRLQAAYFDQVKRMLLIK